MTGQIDLDRYNRPKQKLPDLNALRFLFKISNK